ncbi:MAG TPA: oleate hydratase, partial [Acinetobacter sp.]|nr:oleate hydratase [Acinetobacter sp.]
MQSKKQNTLNTSKSHIWIVGGGIAGMAAAAFAIRDAKVPAQNIHILEELDVSGGSMDGGHNPLNPNHAWVTRGGRMLTDETYLCTWDLFSTIPSLEDPNTSVREECTQFNEQIKTHAQARL